MRNLLTAIIVLACLVFLGSGYLYWKDRTGVVASEVDSTPKKDDHSEATDKEKKEKDVDTKVVELASNWPEEAQADLEKAIENEEAYPIAIVGSLALGGEDGWAAMLKKALEESYGDDVVDVKLFEYDLTSTEFIDEEKYEDVVDFSPKLVLFEPFILNDNGVVDVGENHDNLDTFLDELSDAVVLLQPARPIPDSSIYPMQVQDLERYADTHDIPYLDHWENWPEDASDYVVNGESAPNEKGHEVWFEYLQEYFIAE
ncbi:hydrolase [Bacillus sp. J14TS2]|uniref:SGNH/GDSL hydrolase family protein n=1 Tax=Bacillus sp. J14TS2 TaxID=2807188 RepID=UPI001B026149|nr:SGNH/GDSL hydrolase family protein [Bacillus sp. J14TS2]GIN69631.1 hydrolase [Bacillus sp. J14TS2]